MVAEVHPVVVCAEDEEELAVEFEVDSEVVDCYLIKIFFVFTTRKVDYAFRGVKVTVVEIKRQSVFISR